MINLKLKVEGIKEIVSSLNKKTKALEEDCMNTVSWIGESTADLIRSKAPVDTGALVSAINFRSSKERGGWRSEVVIGVPDRENWQGKYVPYGQYINDAAVFSKANHYSWNAKDGQNHFGFIDAGIIYANDTFPKELIKRIQVTINR